VSRIFEDFLKIFFLCGSQRLLDAKMNDKLFLTASL